MSRTLPFFDRLVQQGRHLQSLGLVQEAIGHWSRLAQLKSLPAATAEEVQNRLGDMQFQRGKFRRASRHFAAAVAHQPHNPHYHYLLAQAIEADPKGDLDKALHHYHQAITMDPHQPAYLAGFGVLALDLGRTEEGLEALRHAAKLAPDDPEIILRVFEGLGESHPEQALGILRLSLFRNPRDARFRKLWSDLHFQRVVMEQERSKTSAGQDQGPTLLPFVPPQPDHKDDKPQPGAWRRHVPSFPGGPHFTSFSDKKHA